MIERRMNPGPYRRAWAAPDLNQIDARVGLYLARGLVLTMLVAAILQGFIPRDRDAEPQPEPAPGMVSIPLAIPYQATAARPWARPPYHRPEAKRAQWPPLPGEGCKPSKTAPWPCD